MLVVICEWRGVLLCGGAVADLLCSIYTRWCVTRLLVQQTVPSAYLPCQMCMLACKHPAPVTAWSVGHCPSAVFSDEQGMAAVALLCFKYCMMLPTAEAGCYTSFLGLHVLHQAPSKPTSTPLLAFDLTSFPTYRCSTSSSKPKCGTVPHCAACMACWSDAHGDGSCLLAVACQPCRK